MLTTSDYLTRLQQDREDLVDNLETKGITGLTGDETFTELVPQVLNIPSGGGADLSQYFNYEPSTVGQYFLRDNFLLKTPDLTIPTGTTSLSNLATSSAVPIPKVICDNSVTNMSSMYYSAQLQGQTTFDLSGLNTSNVTNMDSMFRGCSYITSLDLSSFDTSKVTTTSKMFQSCSNLTSIDLSNKDFSKNNYVDTMFSGCTALTSINLPDFGDNNTNTYSFQSTFYGCSSLTTSDFSKLKNFSYVSTCNGMFNGCSSLTTINLSNFYTNSRVNCSTMFFGCHSLQEIDMRSFDFYKISSQTNMFGDASTGVPNDCLIIVGTDNDKTWINNKFSRLTNVKRADEIIE